MASSKKEKGGDKTEKKKMLIAAMGVVAVFITITSASSLMGSTPLYTVRMEQVSSKMGFLPTTVNGFTYTTERGCTVDYNATKYIVGAVPLMTTPNDTYCETCDPEQTCLGTCQEPTCPQTCSETCDETCPWTCDETCPNTCWATCPNTCEGSTCEGTCHPFECPWTEWIGCNYTQVFPTCDWPGC